MRFSSHLTRTTTWEDPRKTAAAANVAAVAAAVESSKSNSLGPLPDGWEQARTAEGEIYFINHQSRTTSWFDPRIRKSSRIAVILAIGYYRNDDSRIPCIPCIPLQ